MNESLFRTQILAIFSDLCDNRGQINDEELFSLIKKFFKELVPQDKCIALRNSSREE
jgi:hypothetical protein